MQAECWLVKSSWFYSNAASAAGTYPSVSELVAAAEQVAAAGTPPVVLLDTVDLLLHDEADKATLLELFARLGAVGCRVVATCRPQEARLLGGFVTRRERLGDYTDAEMAAAVASHARRCYHRLDETELNRHIARIAGAVSRGLPLREVCRTPLTLRMLFFLYAPNEVPYEIDVFRLYREYWEQRVRRDVRAGSGLSAPKLADLEATAARVALVMLAEGRPELDEFVVRDGVTKAGGTPEELGELRSRGILNLSGRTYRFFHQTFFEHGAARALLQLGKAGVDLLAGRVEQRGTDVFITPVLDHLLLLAEQEPNASVRDIADEVLLRLLAAGPLPARISGIQVYVHRRTLRPGHQSAMRTLLKTDEEAVLLKYLRLAHSMPPDRRDGLFEELELVWETRGWRIREELFDLLGRLAAQSPQRVRAYLEARGVPEDTFTQFERTGKTEELGKLVSLLDALAEGEPQWCWCVLTRVYERTLPLIRSRDLHRRIIDMVRRHASSFGADGIADRFRIAVGNLNDTEGNKGTLTSCFGRLLAYQWQAGAVPLADVCEWMAGASPFLHKAACNGLPELLAQRGGETLSEAFARYEEDTRGEARADWARITWPMLLSRQFESAGRPWQDAVDRLRGLLAERILAAGSDRELRLIAVVLEYADPEVVRLRELFDAPWLADAQPWLTQPRFVSVLAAAYAARHPGAESAMDVLLRSSLDGWSRPAQTVSNDLAKLVSRFPVLLDTFLTLACRIGDGVHVRQVLEKLPPEPLSPTVLAHADELQELSHRLLDSSKGTLWSAGYAIWARLLQYGLGEAPGPDALRLYFEGERDPKARAELCAVVGWATAQARYSADYVVGLLSPLCHDKDRNLSDKAYKALVLALRFAEGDLASHADRVLALATRRSDSMVPLSQLGYLLERLLAGSFAQALDLFLALLDDAAARSGKASGQRDLINRLRRPVRELVRRAPPADRERLLARVPGLDRFLGRLLVEAFCHECFDLVTGTLRELLRDGAVDADVQEIIRRHLHARERTLGSEAWPELYAALRKEPAEAASTGREAPPVGGDSPVAPTDAEKSVSVSRVFISYAHEDERHLADLKKSLSALKREGLVSVWQHHDITAGTERPGRIADELEAADIILLLVSPDFIHSRDCWDVEMKRAMERHAAGTAQVIPIIVRPADWIRAPFARLQPLPQGAKPVSRWEDADEAWLHIIESLRRIVTERAESCGTGRERGTGCYVPDQ